MTLPDVLELKLRDIKKSIVERELTLEEWDYQEVLYLGPGNYRATNNRGKIRLGEEWDNSGKNFFFTKEVKLPQAFQGKELYLEIAIGGESALYVDGQLKRGLNESLIYLSEKAKENYHFKIEATNHIHDAVRYPRLFGQDYPRHYFQKAALVELNRDVEDFYYLLKNVKAALGASKKEEEILFLQQGIEQALKEINFYTLNRQEYLASIAEARKTLLQHLQSASFSPRGKLYAVGHSHLDLAFKWPVKETIRKAKRTLSTTLDLLERYPDLFFAQSQPQLYSYVKKYYPQLYEKIKTGVKTGQLEPIGGMWVEADTNLISGESMVRQLLLGQRFLQEEFGIKSRTCWLPDCFGFSAALPQVLKKAGIDYFLTTKLAWNDTNQIPHNFLRWRGIDGSEVYAYLTTKGYGGEIRAEEMTKAWQKLKDKDLSDTVIYMYGHGDGGGGVTEEMLKNMKALKQIPNLPELKTGKVEAHLEQVFSSADKPPSWWGEFYFEKHRGIYTSQAQLKKYNRKSEFLYREAELWSCLAGVTNKEGVQACLNEGWQLILKNQFHDILPGSCVREVVEDALKDYQKVFQLGTQVREKALQELMKKIQAGTDELVVFNSLAWTRDDLVSLEDPEGLISAILDPDGQSIAMQRAGKKLYFTARKVPSLGYKVYSLVSKGASQAGQEVLNKKMDFQERRLENKFFVLEFNARGNLSRIYDKRYERELIPEGQEANLFQIYEDKSTYFDTWDISISDNKVYNINEVLEFKPKAAGPVFQSVYLKKSFNQSTIEQEIILYADLPRIDFKTRIDWQERQMLLKVAFPLAILTPEANFDIAFGNLSRPVHSNTSWDQARWEVPAHKWADLSEYAYGVSLLNDCKYAYDVKGSNLRLTLLKGGIFPDPKADLGEHYFTYSLYPHGEDYRKGGTIQQGYHLNQKLLACRGLKEFAGAQAKEWSLFEVDAANVIVETIKPAEVGQAYILRCYEAYGQESKVVVKSNFKLTEIKECNLLEEELSTKVELSKEGFSFKIKPYEIKTFKLKWEE